MRPCPSFRLFRRLPVRGVRGGGFSPTFSNTFSVFCVLVCGSSSAYTLHHDQTPLGDYLRRMKSKPGPAGATAATAHKIAVIFYTMVKKQVEYDASIWAKRDAEREKRFEAKLRRQAQQRGYQLVPIEKKPAA